MIFKILKVAWSCKSDFASFLFLFWLFDCMYKGKKDLERERVNKNVIMYVYSHLKTLFKLCSFILFKSFIFI